MALLVLGQALYSQADVTSIGVLPGEVFETSGLIFFNDRLITHNDSGNTPQLFEVDTTTRAITRTITIENVENIDWEDIAQDENYIYLGDFGNNLGGRTDLAVYRISKSDYLSSAIISADKIEFTYEDQTDFSGGQNSDWDAEAFIVLKEQLIIFTKQWQSNGTVAYSLPKTPGTHMARNLGSYNSSGLITGATYNKISEVLFLVGYSQQLQPFVIRLEGITDVFNFDGTIQKSSLSLGFAQVEGITYTDENTYYLSSEHFTNSNPPITLDARLFRFTTTDTPAEEEEPEEPPPGEEEPEEGEDTKDLVVFISAGSKQVQYNLSADLEVFGRAIFDVSGRLLRNTHASEIESNTIDLVTYTSGVYYLTFYTQGRTISKPFFLN